MKKRILNEAYELLFTNGLVRNESEFSVYWLGKSESYLRSVRCKNVQPSVPAIAVCASKLQYYGNLFNAIDDRKTLSDQFLRLSSECHKYVNDRVGKMARKKNESAVYA
jgi:hypothetical protein